MSQATHPYKGRIRISATLGIPAAWSDALNILEVRDIDGPKPQIADAKRTQLLSPNKAHEFAPGLLDGGDVTLACNFLRTAFAPIYSVLHLQRIWQVLLPDLAANLAPGSASDATLEAGSKWLFFGHVKQIGTEDKVDADVIEAPITFRISGKPLFVAGLSGMAYTTFTAANATANPSPCTLAAGGTVGQSVLGVAGYSSTLNSWRVFDQGEFESTLSVAGQIQQITLEQLGSYSCFLYFH